MIQLGNSNIDEVYLGGKKIKEMYLGNKLVYQAKKNGFWYVCSDTSFDIKLNGSLKGTTVLCQPNIKTFYSIKNFESARNMFSDCSSLTLLDLSSVDSSNLTQSSLMFINCTALTSLDLSNFNTSNVTDISSMFENCQSLTSLDLSSFDTSKVTKMEKMFSGCSSLVSLDLSNFSTNSMAISGQVFFRRMFLGCTNLKHIKCKQAFKDWCFDRGSGIDLPEAMYEGGSGTWEIVD